MVNNNRLLIAQQRLVKQGFDEVHQMVNLLQFASTVLVELAVTREDVQGFKQVYGLIGANFCWHGHAAILRQNPNKLPARR